MSFAQPPPRGNKKTRMGEALKELQKDVEAVEEIKKQSEGLLFLDLQSPAVRRRRQLTRQLFEEWVEGDVGREGMTTAEIWNTETLVDRTSRFLRSLAKISQGLLGQKCKIGTLREHRNAIHWWAFRFVGPASLSAQNWHCISNAAIGKAALEYGLETSSREKQNLTSVELQYFWTLIGTHFKIGVDNWLQHYTAWLLVFVTATRSGSFTVCPGYGKGDLLSNGAPRSDVETLRWSDIEFFRTNGPPRSIYIRITFRFTKGHRNPVTGSLVSGMRTFTILPLNSNKYELDLALQLVALAFSRGLFPYSSPEALVEGQELGVPTVPDVASQPVFVASNQAGKLEVDTAMHEKALNPKLQEMCIAAGLLGRNTMYSLRREAIVTTRRKEGTEMAREVAAHKIDSATIYAYDHFYLADKDLANSRNDLDEMSRKEMREMFAQIRTEQFSTGSEELTASNAANNAKALDDRIRSEASVRAYADQENILQEAAVNGVIQEATELLISKGVKLELLANHTDIVDHLREHAATDTDGPRCLSLIAKLDDARKTAKTTLRRLREKHKKAVVDEMRKEAQAKQKAFNSKQSKTIDTRAAVTVVEKEMQGPPNAKQSAALADRIRLLEAASTSVGLDEEAELNDVGLDVQAREEYADQGRNAPPQWDGLPDAEVTILPHNEAEDPAATYAGRLEFIEKVLGMRSARNTNLKCIPCQSDDTVPYGKKVLAYTASDLNRHLKSNYHSRNEQIIRAFFIDAGDGGSAPCSICGEVIKKGNRQNIIRHLENEHDWILAY